MDENNIVVNIYGAILMGLITAGIVYVSYNFWNDNSNFSVLIGFFALITLFYTGFFLTGIIKNIKKKK